MKRSYLCPKCDGVLNPNIKIILKTERAGRAALLLFSPQPGNYDVIVSPNVENRPLRNV